MINRFISGLVFELFSAGVSAQQDPTAPWGSPNVPSVSPQKAPVLALPTLQSLVCDERTCQGIVNNQFVSEGDRITDFRVVSITSSFLVIEKANRQWRLTVLTPPQGIKIG